MRIKVLDSENNELYVFIEPSNTIEKLKFNIRKLKNIPESENIQLFYNSQRLLDNKKVIDYNIEDEADITYTGQFNAGIKINKNNYK
jgi:hypothetical protein